MKTALVTNNINLQPSLKVVKNNIKLKRKSNPLKRIAINTLVPNFNYINEKGELISSVNSVLL